MNMLKFEIVERISKIIVLKDMIIVRYKNPEFKKPVYRIYNLNGKLIMYGIHYYSELLWNIQRYRHDNTSLIEFIN